MIVLYTTERDYSWGTLRSTHASKTKVVLVEKCIPYRIENLPPGHLWKKPPGDAIARAKIRMIEQYADEALLVGNLPPIWMPYWSDPDKRDIERMEKGREGLRSPDLPYIEKVLAEGPVGGYICGDF